MPRNEQKNELEKLLVRAVAEALGVETSATASAARTSRRPAAGTSSNEDRAAA